MTKLVIENLNTDGPHRKIRLTKKADSIAQVISTVGAVYEDAQEIRACLSPAENLQVNFQDSPTILNSKVVVIQGTGSVVVGDVIELTITSNVQVDPVITTLVTVSVDGSFETNALDLSGYSSAAILTGTVSKFNSVKYGFVSTSDTVNYPTLTLQWSTLPRPLSISLYFKGVANNGNTWVIVGNAQQYGNAAVIVTSTDGGNTWVRPTIPANGQSWTVAYGEGKFIATTASGVFLSSTDGLTWSEVVPDNQASYYDIVYTGTHFIAGGEGGRISVSADGVSWPLSVYMDGNVYGCTYGGGKYVVVGEEIEGATTYGRVVTSSDGITWTGIRLDVNNRLKAVTYGNGQFVAVGVNGKIYTSPDAVTWTLIASNLSATLQDIVYWDGEYYVVDDSGNLWVSTNITTWTLILNADGRAMYGITVSNGQFMAVGAASKVVVGRLG